MDGYECMHVCMHVLALYVTITIDTNIGSMLDICIHYNYICMSNKYPNTINSP